MLSNLDFRNLFIGRLFLNLGDSLVYIIFMWFLYNMTGDSLFAGIGGFFFTLPPFLGIFFGPIVDRKDHRKLLVLFSTILLVLTLLLTVLTVLFGFNVYLLLLGTSKNPSFSSNLITQTLINQHLDFQKFSF